MMSEPKHTVSELHRQMEGASKALVELKQHVEQLRAQKLRLELALHNQFVERLYQLHEKDLQGRVPMDPEVLVKQAEELQQMARKAEHAACLKIVQDVLDKAMKESSPWSTHQALVEARNRLEARGVGL